MHAHDRLNQLSGEVLAASFTVHTALGPGLLESAYEACLVHELRHRGLGVEQQRSVPVRYRDRIVRDAGFRLDLLVEDQIVVEVKSVDEIHPVHRAQLLTYLKLSNKHLGLLLNFNVARLKDGGIHRLVQGPPPL